MNFLGKILVILIMLFSVAFMALASVVFSTSVNYKEQAEKLDASLKKSQGEANAARQDAEAAKLATTEAEKKAGDEQTRLNETIAGLTARLNDVEAEKKDAGTQLAVAQQSFQQAQAEAAARIREADTLRSNLTNVEKENNALKIAQTEKNATIRELEIKLETALGQNRNLLADNSAYASWLRSRGFTDDISQIKGVSVPPKVQGVILQVNNTNDKAVLSIGSDDGLVVGHELVAYRTGADAGYLGKLKIMEVEPNRASAVVVNKTYQGKRLQEGDIVSSTLPRGN